MRMDLSKFKFVSSDGKTTTLKHPRGHVITIAHANLEPEHKVAFEAMAKAANQPTAESQKKASKHSPKMMADGGEVEADEPKKTLGEMINYPGTPKPKPTEKPQTFADGGDVQPSDDSNAQPAVAAPQQAPVVVNVGTPQTQAPTPTPQPGIMDSIQHALMPGLEKYAGQPQVGFDKTPEQARQENADSLATPSPTPNAASPEATPAQPQAAAPSQPPGDPFGTQAYQDAYVKGLDEQKQGLAGVAQAEGQQSKAEAAALNQNIQQQQQNAQTYQTHYDELNKERQAFQQDVQNQHIDPTHYLSSMGTGQKIGTAIGLILGGLGGGLNKTGSNPVMDFLNTQINRDVDAQKAELGKRENLLSANMRQFGVLKDAQDMTRVMQMDILSSQLKKAASQAGSPAAKARALQAAGQLDQQAAPVLSQIAMRRTLLGGMQSGKVAPEQVVRMIVPPNEQGPAYKELKDAQDTIAFRDNALKAFDQLDKTNTVGNRALHVGFTPAAVKALKDPLVAALSKNTAGRFTEQDAGMLESLFPSPGDSPETIRTKRIQLVKMANEKMHFPMLQAYGINMGATGRFDNQGQSRIQESAPVIPKK